MRYFLICALFGVCFLLGAGAATAIAGEPPVKNIKITGSPLPPSEAIFIGEVHGLWEGRPFIFRMLEMLHKERGMNKIVMECGKSDAWMFNAYLRDGDTTILEYYGRSATILSALKSWQELYNETGVTVYGVDFERSAFLYAVSALLRRHATGTNTEIYKYLQTAIIDLKDVDDDKSGKRANSRAYNHARKLFSKEREKLKTILAGDYTVVADIMENPARQDKFGKRDEAMAANLIEIPRPFLCVMGMGHTTLHKQSTLKRYAAAAPGTTPLVINMVCRNCYTSSYFRELTVPMIADYEERNTDYMLIHFDDFYSNGVHPVIEQHEFKDIPGGYNNIPTYYVLFKDQPKW